MEWNTLLAECKYSMTLDKYIDWIMVLFPGYIDIIIPITCISITVKYVIVTLWSFKPSWKLALFRETHPYALLGMTTLLFFDQISISFVAQWFASPSMNRAARVRFPQRTFFCHKLI